MFPEDINESDARQAIETLMDEEAEIAEDPTQNAMLPQAPPSKSAQPMEPESPVAEDESDDIQPQDADTEYPEQSEQSQAEVEMSDGEIGRLDDIEPMELDPVQTPDSRPDPDWDDAIQDMMLRALEEHADDPEPPALDRIEDEMGWQAALADRTNSL